MVSPDTWTTLARLVEFTRDGAPVYLLLAVLPIVALYKGGIHAFLRASAALALAHVGPFVMLFIGAAWYGQAHGYSFLGTAQLAIGSISVITAAWIANTLSPIVPKWALILFFAGLTIMSLLAWAVGAMALTNDWL